MLVFEDLNLESGTLCFIRQFSPFVDLAMSDLEPESLKLKLLHHLLLKMDLLSLFNSIIIELLHLMEMQTQFYPALQPWIEH